LEYSAVGIEYGRFGTLKIKGLFNLLINGTLSSNSPLLAASNKQHAAINNA
jgi:hypothetical protein